MKDLKEGDRCPNCEKLSRDVGEYPVGKLCHIKEVLPYFINHLECDICESVYEVAGDDKKPIFIVKPLDNPADMEEFKKVWEEVSKERGVMMFDDSEEFEVELNKKDIVL